MAPSSSRPSTPVPAETLRRIFNEHQYFERVRAGEFKELVIDSHAAPSVANQPPGTKSEIAEYRSPTERVALVHQYKLPNGGIGGSGRPDPKQVLHEGVLYVLERQRQK
jgi:hypothetical protein